MTGARRGGGRGAIVVRVPEPETARIAAAEAVAIKWEIAAFPASPSPGRSAFGGGSGGFKAACKQQLARIFEYGRIAAAAEAVRAGDGAGSNQEEGAYDPERIEGDETHAAVLGLVVPV